MAVEADGRPWNLRESYLFDRVTIAEIHRAAREGIYDIRGFGAKRRLPHFDDLLLLVRAVHVGQRHVPDHLAHGLGDLRQHELLGVPRAERRVEGGQAVLLQAPPTR